jgi:hypothetical protein
MLRLPCYGVLCRRALGERFGGRSRLIWTGSKRTGEERRSHTKNPGLSTIIWLEGGEAFRNEDKAR